MKTIKEWFESLDEPYRSQAIFNSPMAQLGKKATSLIHALEKAFVWEETSQGHFYWLNLTNEIDYEMLNNRKNKKS